ncbi:hypothetical protein [Benzoatithermus flavus]|uniref:CopG-like ribbon-helix-helix domain-containing protein n=1 Tax=Benzoatithermus flavus TaxID=3108223 RepID=A0ABU8XWK8_9PROT
MLARAPIGDEAAGPAMAGGPDRKLTLSLPAGVVRQLRARMAAEETTLRALVLEALAGAGYAVPAGEIRDRRRRETTAGRVA